MLDDNQAASARNPTWTRDELIVALAFYLAHRPSFPGKSSAEITTLSQSVQAVARANGLSGGDDFRNINGVYMKLMNFRSLDPAYTASGKIGLERIGRADRDVWDEFSSDPAGCSDRARRIVASAAPTPRYWAFVADPDRYRIQDAVRDLSVDTWTTKGKDIRPGDWAIIWQARDRQGRRGVIALAEIIGAPELRSDADNPYWIDEEDKAQRVERVPVRYERIPEPLWVAGQHGSLLSTLNVARARGGTVFYVTPDQWQALASLAALSRADYVATKRSARGQGFGLTAAERKAVEEHAMRLAASHFEARWDTVEDVGRFECYDLRCRRGASSAEHHVEVKGTTGLGGSIILTRNEVEHARQVFPNVSLFVVHGINLERKVGQPPIASGGTVRLLEPWQIAHCELIPASYDCRLPAETEGA